MPAASKQKPKGVSKIRCETAKRYMAAASIYASGPPISDTKLTKMTAHIFQCPACKSAYDQLQMDTERDVDNMESSAPPAPDDAFGRRGHGPDRYERAQEL